MIEIANNIQDLHNSMDSTLPENNLAMITEYVDPDNDRKDDSGNNDGMKQVLECLSEAFGDSDGEGQLKKDSETLDLAHAKTKATKRGKSSQLKDAEVETCTAQMANVYEFAPEDAVESRTNQDQTQKEIPRFKTATTQLNALAMSQLVAREPGKENGPSSCPQVQPNGTWESIVLWGVQEGLDDEQQVAMEILIATFVLTFYEEADENESNPCLKEIFEGNKNNLELLARKSTGPLRLFVTGAAGSGKCEFLQNFFCLSIFFYAFTFFSHFVNFFLPCLCSKNY
jgi:hypothetical protein